MPHALPCGQTIPHRILQWPLSGKTACPKIPSVETYVCAADPSGHGGIFSCSALRAHDTLSGSARFTSLHDLSAALFTILGYKNTILISLYRKTGVLQSFCNFFHSFFTVLLSRCVFYTIIGRGSPVAASSAQKSAGKPAQTSTGFSFSGTANRILPACSACRLISARLPPYRSSPASG
ncbi:hypothetical protein SDC9_99525 [bioreactor metagenome]|uniref:Uncharacterized protein n=1 Tax=bioreactor metagenome TaxID=1076179 RepID=A0A645APG8_9ZZZZ